MLGLVALLAWCWITFWPEDVGKTFAKIRRGYDMEMEK